MRRAAAGLPEHGEHHGLRRHGPLPEPVLQAGRGPGRALLGNKGGFIPENVFAHTLGQVDRAVGIPLHASTQVAGLLSISHDRAVRLPECIPVYGCKPEGGRRQHGRARRV